MWSKWSRPRADNGVNLATNIIMPALEMAQETGKVLRWLKPEGTSVAKGEPIMEIETDKVTVEIEAPAAGILAGFCAREGDSVPVGQTIGWVLAAGESVPAQVAPVQSGRTHSTPGASPQASQPAPPAGGRAAAVGDQAPVTNAASPTASITASPVAMQIAKEHGIDLASIKPGGGRVEKADVLAYLDRAPLTPLPASPRFRTRGGAGRGVPASPKARRLAAERGIDLASLAGSGPEGAVLAVDVTVATPTAISSPALAGRGEEMVELSTVWRVMAERMTASWTTVPHFYLLRQVAASALVEMRARITPAVEKRSGIKPTYSDLLVKLIAAVLPEHPRVNASWVGGGIRLNPEVHIGLATAIEDGLIVPVIHNANALTIGEIAAQREDLVARANAGKLKPADISGGTFTLTNLGMYNVDAFHAIVNSPQAAILAVGRISDQVVAVNGQPAVRPMMTLALSCDHRAVDGARAAQFLDDLARLIQEPWGILA